jgi:prepilin-type N-terminal cleavage/methylation domain-containing protein/prepilin-type processing-associated H-X9-DG protein
MKRRGFTMTEMLVVLGIILLVVGMLLPMIARARRAAALTKCLAQMNQLGHSLIDFADAHDGQFPAASPVSGSGMGGGAPGGAGTGTEAMKAIGTKGPPGPFEANRGSGGGAGMSGNIRAFLVTYVGKDAKIWKCPEQPMKPPGSSAEPYAFVCNDETGEFFPGHWYVVGGTWSHGYMADMGGAGGQLPPLPLIAYDRNGAIDPLARRSGTALKWPLAKVVLFADSSIYFHSRQRVRPPESDSNLEFVSNFAFLDGHAETVRFKSMQAYRELFQPGAMVPPEPAL